MVCKTIGRSKLCSSNECKICTERSFISHYRSKQLVDKTINARMIYKSSYDVYEFKCDICNHIFESTVNNVVRLKGCPYCSCNTTKLCKDDSCTMCYENSFASITASQYIVGIDPRTINKCSGKKYEFLCNLCGKLFNASLADVTCKNSFCPYCKCKSELKLKNWFEKFIEFIVESNKRFDWCRNTKTKYYLPFDFVIEFLKIIIELDGRQHFTQVGNWKSPEDTQEGDKYKMKKALENGYTVIRLLQTDVKSDKNQWDEKLTKAIKKYDTPQIVYICSDNEYDVYKD